MCLSLATAKQESDASIDLDVCVSEAVSSI